FGERVRRRESLVEAACVGAEKLGSMDNVRRCGRDSDTADRFQQFHVWRMAVATRHWEKTDAGDGSFFAWKRRAVDDAAWRGDAHRFWWILLLPESGISIAVLLRTFGSRLSRDLRVPRPLLDVGKCEGREEGGRERFQPNAFGGDSGNHVDIAVIRG